MKNFIILQDFYYWRYLLVMYDKIPNDKLWEFGDKLMDILMSGYEFKREYTLDQYRIDVFYVMYNNKNRTVINYRYPDGLVSYSGDYFKALENHLPPIGSIDRDIIIVNWLKKETGLVVRDVQSTFFYLG